MNKKVRVCCDGFRALTVNQRQEEEETGKEQDSNGSTSLFMASGWRCNSLMEGKDLATLGKEQ